MARLASLLEGDFGDFWRQAKVTRPWAAKLAINAKASRANPHHLSKKQPTTQTTHFPHSNYIFDTTPKLRQ
jgi:hypothetical protein